MTSHTSVKWCMLLEPQVPHLPRKLMPHMVKHNCSVDVTLTWKHPRSDAPIGTELFYI